MNSEIEAFFGDIGGLKKDVEYIKDEIDKKDKKVEKDLDGIFERLRCLEIKFSTFRGQIITAIAVIQAIAIVIIKFII